VSLSAASFCRLRSSNADDKAAAAAAAAATLLLKGVDREQQQHLRQVAAAIDSLTSLVSRPAPQQQQQQQLRLFTCLSGAHLQVRLPCSKPGPVIVQHCSSSSSVKSPGLVAVPDLQSPGAEAALQQVLPVGCAVSVLLCPCSVWANSKCVGVTLNCLQVLKL
jgi:hypothetical protein